MFRRGSEHLKAHFTRYTPCIKHFSEIISYQSIINYMKVRTICLLEFQQKKGVEKNFVWDLTGNR